MRGLNRRARLSPRGSARGFTLLETLVAIAILGVGITSVLQLMGASARTAVRTQTMTEAVFVAQELMEEMLTLDESGLRARGQESGDYAEHERRIAKRGLSFDVPAGRSPRYEYTLRTTPDRGEAGLYHLEVEVAWPEPGGGRISVATLRRFVPDETEELAR